MKNTNILLPALTLVLVLGFTNAVVAQYDYGTPAPAAAPAAAPVSQPASAPSSAVMPLSSPGVPNTGSSPASTAADPGSAAPAIPNTGAGGEAAQNWILLAASVLTAAVGLSLFSGSRKTP